MKLQHWIALGVLAVTAIWTIMFLAAPWIAAELEFGGVAAINVKISLWGMSYSCDDFPGTCLESKSWHKALTENDSGDQQYAYCPDHDVKNNAVWHAIQGAQAGAVLAVLTGIVYAACVIAHLLGKLRKKRILLIPSGIFIFFAVLCFGMFQRAYSICPDESLCEVLKKDIGVKSCGASATCEQFVTIMMANGAIEASCGPAAGVWLVWAAQAVGVGSFVCLLIGRPPALAAAATPNANAHPINAVPYQAFPAQQQAPVGVV